MNSLPELTRSNICKFFLGMFVFCITYYFAFLLLLLGDLSEVKAIIQIITIIMPEFYISQSNFI